jgi:hypothetical protein
MVPSISTDQVFRRHQKVVAASDLPGVPAGTPGKVYYVAGVTWIRYHVLFENGVEVSSVDAGELVDLKAWRADAAAKAREAQQAQWEIERRERREAALANLADESAGH